MVLVTSTLNRVMVVEYALPALLPGVLVALHYAVQLIRPRFGHGSDKGGRCTPWITGGMAALSIGGILCALATTGFASHPLLALALAIVAYGLVGMGVGAAGTSLLVLMAKRVDEGRRAAAATIMWVLMIAGFAITSTTVGHFLDPFSPRRLVSVIGIAAAIAFTIAVLAVGKVESSGEPSVAERKAAGKCTFKTAVRRAWSDPQARVFTLFVFTSMLAYSAQELLLEPFAGLVYGYTLGESTRLFGTLAFSRADRFARDRHRLQWALAIWLIEDVDHRRLRRIRARASRPCLRRYRRASLAVTDFRGCTGRCQRRICRGSHRLDDGTGASRRGGERGGTDGSLGRGPSCRVRSRAALQPRSSSTRFAMSLVRPVAAFAIVFGAEALLFLVAAGLAVQPTIPNTQRLSANVRADAA